MKSPSGWKGQSLRHSRARKYGRAGGRYKVCYDPHRRNIKAQEIVIHNNRLYKLYQKDGTKYVKIGKNYVVWQYDPKTRRKNKDKGGMFGMKIKPLDMR